jgi:hypothetical protein
MNVEERCDLEREEVERERTQDHSPDQTGTKAAHDAAG